MTFLYFIAYPQYAQAYDINNLFQHVILSETPTSYNIIEKNEEIEISAIGQNSASGLYLKDPLNYLPDYPSFSWLWKVDEIQISSNLSEKENEDFAASLQFIFGKKTLISKPTVLTYAWTGMDSENETVIKSPRIPDNFRTIIVDNNMSPLSMWKMHKRDIREDYKLAFGEYPKQKLTALGIFTDNDQTKENVKSHYKISLKK